MEKEEKRKREIEQKEAARKYADLLYCLFIYTF